MIAAPMVSPKQTYPPRDKLHCLKVTRALFSRGTANQLGLRAVLLVIYIAHKEDELRYRGPVKCWNLQLYEALGVRSPKQLDEARKEAINAGWLVYIRTNDRKVGHYFTILPPEYVSSPTENALNEGSQPDSVHTLDQFATFSGSGKHGGSRLGKNAGSQVEAGNGKPPSPAPLPESIERLIEGRLADFDIGEIQIRSSRLETDTRLDSSFCLLVTSVAYCFGVEFCDSLLMRFDSSKRSRREPVEKPKQYIVKAMENECRKHSCEWSEVSARIDTAMISRPIQLPPASVKLDEATELAFRQWWDVFPRKDFEQDARGAFAIALSWLRTAERMKVGAADYLLSKTLEHVPYLIANGVENCPLAHDWLGNRRWREDVAPCVLVPSLGNAGQT